MESVEGSALDLALDSLDMLSTVTTARRDYLNELRARGIRPPPSIRSRSDFLYASSSSPYGSRRKENVIDGVGGAMQLYCASSSPNKLVKRTSCKFRPTPYTTFNRSHCSTKRKPLNALLNPVTPSYSYFSTRTRTSDSWSSAEAASYKDIKFLDFSETSSSSFQLSPLIARSKSLEDLPTTPGGSSWNCPVDDGDLEKITLRLKGSEGVDESMSMLIEKLNVTS